MLYLFLNYMFCVCVLFLQLLSYAEMLTSATNICEALKDIPCIGDGDTGYGNSVNVKRTVKGYAQVRHLGYYRSSLHDFVLVDTCSSVVS